MPQHRRLAAVVTTAALCAAYTLATYTASSRAETQRPLHATVMVNGRSRRIAFEAGRVDDLLTAEGINVHPCDLVNPSLSSRTRDGMTIRVLTEEVSTQIHHHTVAAPVEFKRTIRLLPGRRQDVRPGKDGIQAIQLQVHRLGGVVTSRTVIATRWIRKPVSKVVLVGTDPFMASRSLDGLDRLTRCITLNATEYDVWLGGAGSGRTATGVRARRGIAAVDPRVIPLGTRLYVEGYGYCVAADTGGAIKGRRIDLCVPTTHEADRYGRHRVRVFILGR